mmetsp:Transcript_22829/g.76656  ORF Transcript_22829/g.76656 Transcript_22829/m.76656 type:complete len:158 (+) Transcript_22829:371-844(+)
MHVSVRVGDEFAGALVFKLETDAAPRACERFASLLDPRAGAEGPAYEGTCLHRVLPGGWAQGGITVAKETRDPVPDESFAVAHDRPGVIGFANEGPHSSTAQLYITFAPQPALDTKFVAFGRLVDGLDVLRKIEGVETANGRPVQDVTIFTGGKFGL